MSTSENDKSSKAAIWVAVITGVFALTATVITVVGGPVVQRWLLEEPEPKRPPTTVPGGHPTSTQNSPTPTAQTSAPGMDPNGGFKGIVLDQSTETKVPGVQIIFESTHTGVEYATVTDERGVYEIDLPVDGYFVTAAKDGFEPYSTGSGTANVIGPYHYNFHLTVAPSSSLATEVPAEASGGLIGIVIDVSTALKVPGVKLIFENVDTGMQRAALTGSNGAYEIPLPPGRYRVSATHPDFQPSSTDPGWNLVGKDFGTYSITLIPN